MQRIFVIVLLAGLLLACAPAAATATQPAADTQATPLPTATAVQLAINPVAAKAVEDYLQGIVSKDVDKVSTLSCKEWEQQAIQELDSLQAVKAALSGVACTQSGTDGGTSLVNCTGKIVITYDNENQELDLSLRTYRVTQSGGDWQVCGYQQ